MIDKETFLERVTHIDCLKPKFWWDKFAWFMVILGVVELLVWHRWFGYLAIGAGILMLIINHMKDKKWGLFKPKILTPLEEIREARMNVTDVACSVAYCSMIVLKVFVLLCVTTLLTIGGFKIWYWADQGMKHDCYQCSWNDCNQTLMNEQEYGNNQMCNDMGNYEMVWKIGGMIGFMGIAFTFMVAGMELWQLWRVGR